MSQNRSIEKYNYYISGLFGASPYDPAQKSKVIDDHIRYMVLRTQSMFKWEGLPDTVPAYMLELMLQLNGNVCWYQHNGALYVFCGGLGGEPDEYYRPTVYTIANPALKLSKSLKIGTDCIVMKNDSLIMGVRPLFSRYATALAENELSLDIVSVMTRLTALITAPDDSTKEAGEIYLKELRAGNLGILADDSFLQSIKVQPYSGASSNGDLTNLIEYEQYLKASWYNDIGLNANYNMKRESINSGESQLNNDALLPLVDEMLRCRQDACEEINTMFGTNISVSFASSWEDNEIEIEAEQEAIEEIGTASEDNEISTEPEDNNSETA